MKMEMYSTNPAGKQPSAREVGRGCDNWAQDIKAVFIDEPQEWSRAADKNISR